MFKETYWNSDISNLHKYGNISNDIQPEFGGEVSKMKQVDFAAIKTTEPWVWIFLLKIVGFFAWLNSKFIRSSVYWQQDERKLLKVELIGLLWDHSVSPPAGVNLRVWSYLLISDDADPAASTLLCTFSSRTSCGCGDVEIFWLFCILCEQPESCFHWRRRTWRHVGGSFSLCTPPKHPEDICTLSALFLLTVLTVRLIRW